MGEERRVLQYIYTPNIKTRPSPVQFSRKSIEVQDSNLEKYDGNTDRQEHIINYRTAMRLQEATKEVMYFTFSMTLNKESETGINRHLLDLQLFSLTATFVHTTI